MWNRSNYFFCNIFTSLHPDVESYLESQGHMANGRLKGTATTGLNPEEHQELLDRLTAAEQRTARAEEALERSIEDLNKMRFANTTSMLFNGSGGVNFCFGLII